MKEETQITYQFTQYAQKQWDMMLAACNWFDPSKHYLVAMEDDNGNILDLIYIGRNRESCQPALLEFWDSDLPNQVTLLTNGRSVSFKL